jgi:hypothetical protein
LTDDLTLFKEIFKVPFWLNRESREIREWSRRCDR